VVTPADKKPRRPAKAAPSPVPKKDEGRSGLRIALALLRFLVLHLILAAFLGLAGLFIYLNNVRGFPGMSGEQVLTLLTTVIVAPVVALGFLHATLWRRETPWFLLVLALAGIGGLWWLLPEKWWQHVPFREPVRVFHALPGAVRSVAFNPDGKYIVTGGGTSGERSEARLSDSTTGRDLGMVLEGHTDAINTAVFSPDGKHIATASDDKTVRLWGDDGKPVRKFEGHQGWVFAVAFSSDGKRMVSASYDDTVRVWDADRGSTLHTIPGPSLWARTIAFSPDGRYFATGSGGSRPGEIKLWDATTYQEVRTFKGHERAVLGLVFSHDGDLLASASEDGTVKVWGVRSGLEVHTLRGHNGPVHSVVFSPEGRRLASGGADGTIKVWRPGTGEDLLTLYSRPVLSVAFSPDGKRLAAGGKDGRVKIWEMPAGI
jgi:WD40 repeat protein